LIRALAEAAAVWTSPHSTERRETAAALHDALPLAAAMVDHGLDLIFGAISEDGIRELIASQVDDIGDLDRTRDDPDGRERRLLGPATIYHSMAGNIPGLAIPVLVCGVLARSVTLIRDSRRQPILTRAFLATLTRIDPIVSAMVLPIEADVSVASVREAFGNTEAVVELHGSDPVVDELSLSFAGLPTTKHGSRASVVIASAGEKPVDWVEKIAHDIVMYEGLGCLTPHTVIVEGFGSTQTWAQALSAALDDFESSWPRQRQSFELETTRRAFLERTEVSSLLGDGQALLRGRGDCWCIAQSTAAAASTGPGMRCVTIIASADRDASLAILGEMELPVAGIGLTMKADSPQMHHSCEELRRRSGASLVCCVGDMQSPTLAWEQDGGRRLGDLLDWRPPPT
jgi:hypothetical protein